MGRAGVEGLGSESSGYRPSSESRGLKGEDRKPCPKKEEHGRLNGEAISLLIKHASKKEK